MRLATGGHGTCKIRLSQGKIQKPRRPTLFKGTEKNKVHGVILIDVSVPLKRTFSE